MSVVRHRSLQLASDARAPAAARLWRNVLLDSFFEEAVARQSDRIAVVDGKRVVQQSELDSAVARTAAGLRDLGIQPGDAVSWILPNWYEAIVVHHAAIRIGAVSNPVVPIYRHREVEYILRQAESKIVIIPEAFRGFDYPAMIAGLDIPDLEHVIVARASSPRHHHLDTLGQTGGDAERGAPEPTRSADDPVLLMYTSGTTARPKGVIHSHNTMVHELISMIELFNLTSQDTIFMPSPLTHITGVLYGIHLPVILQSSVVLQDIWDPAAAARLIHQHSASFTVGATPFLHGLMHQPDPPGGRLAMRVFACGGADVPPQLVRDAARRLDCCVARVYGSTEHPTVSGCGFGDTIDKRASTDGRAIGGNEVRILREDGSGAAPETVGEIVVRGPEQFLGYLEADASSGAYTSDGWFRTGDLGAVDHDGYLEVVGRKKDIIIRGGENLSVKEIEGLLLEHEWISDVAVVGMPDPILGERVCAFVVPSPHGVPTLNAVAAFLRDQKVAIQKLPERLEVVSELPRTASGKIQKFLLRERIQALVASEHSVAPSNR